MRNALIIMICALAGLAPALAQRVDPAAMFEHADTDRDGAITRQEFLAARADSFSVFDRDGDGSLSSGEYRSGAPAGAPGMMVSTMFSRLDADGDKSLSVDEFNAAPTPGFDRADANGDGVLQNGEIASARRSAP